MAASSLPYSVLSQAPDLSRVSPYGRDQFNNFFAYTDENQIASYANGSNLENLAELAACARNVIHIARLNISPDNQVQDQWQLNRLSEIKQRLAKAIEMKRSYYDNHLLGIITKCVLMLFCKWNKGDTAAIVAAEDFLLMWDSRKPVMKISNPDNASFGKYFERQDYHPDNLDVSRYFNYNPRRLIEMENGEKFDYAPQRAVVD